VGFGPSKTLAKLANHMAKKNPEFEGVCDLHSMTRLERRQWMSKIEVGEVWGVGRRINARLAAMGIDTVLDLRNASTKAIRAQFGVVMERTCEELRGVPCLELEEIAPPKQQIMSSRSFGKPVECIEELQEAVATYVGRAAEKLRQQGSVSWAVYVFVQTNPFKENERQYNAGITVPLLDSSDDTRLLIGAALRGLKTIYRKGYRYKKAGIMLTLLSDKATQQGTLFSDSGGRQRSARLMAAMDAANREFGRNTLRSAASGIYNTWVMRAGNRSPCYTTRWDDLPETR
jgi:DNA polymerase V